MLLSSSRRSFIKSLLIAAVAPQVLLPKEPIKWKRSTQGLYINPEWITADYELALIGAFNPKLFTPITWPANMGETLKFKKQPL